MKVIPFGDNTEESVLKLAAACERLSEHSLAKAILEKAKNLILDIPNANEFKAIPGQGVACKIDDSMVLIGTENLLNSHEISLSASDTYIMQEMEQDGLTPILIAYSGKVAGMIGIADTVREEMRESLHSLKNGGVKKVVMLTGDSPEVARRVAESVGIDEWQARLLPQQKVEAIRKLQEEGYKVAMVGDGINDAPALAQADVGIAMGVTGTDIAMEASNVVLLKDDVLSAAESIQLSRLTLKTTNQNLIFALIFNGIGVALASTGMLSPIASALFHNIGSVAVVVNSARLVSNKN
jgi:P-type E1-E2 ATPase